MDLRTVFGTLYLIGLELEARIRRVTIGYLAGIEWGGIFHHNFHGRLRKVDVQKTNSKAKDKCRPMHAKRGFGHV
jgi:hypothetical protein